MARFSERLRQSIVPTVPDDRSDVVEFQRRMYGPDSHVYDDQRDRWLQRNPWGQERVRSLVCRQNGAVVGVQCEVPFEVAGVERAAWAIDLMVDPAWRIRGVGPALVDAQMERNDLVAAIGVSDDARKVYLEKGWADLGNVPLYLRPVEPRRFATKMGRRPRAIAAIAAPLLYFADTILRMFHSARGFRLERVDHLDGRIDVAWAEARREHRLIARRDDEALTWAVDERPGSEFLDRYLLLRRDQVVGYVVLRAGTWNSQPVVRAVDYLVPVRRTSALFALVIAEARKERASAVLLHTLNEQADRSLRRVGFVRRSDAYPTRLMVWVRDPSTAGGTSSEPSSWFVTLTDSDLEETVLRYS